MSKAKENWKKFWENVWETIKSSLILVIFFGMLSGIVLWWHSEEALINMHNPPEMGGLLLFLKGMN